MAYANFHEFLNGKLVLYTRQAPHVIKRKPTYHARLKIDDQIGYIVRSTKRTDLMEAYAVAKRWYDEAQSKSHMGLIVVGKSFEKTYRKWLNQSAFNVSKHRLSYMTKVGERYFIPFFGDRLISSVTSQIVASYWPWRIDYWKTQQGEDQIKTAQRRRWSPKHPKRNTLHIVAKTPSQPTLRHEQAILRTFFKWAQSLGIVAHLPIVEAPKKAGRPAGRRPGFEIEEWIKLRKLLDQWIDEPKSRRGLNKHTYFHRKLTRCYIIFMAASGLRPNEARQLRWGDIHWSVAQNNAPQYCWLQVAPTTKTGAREVVILSDGVFALIDLVFDLMQQGIIPESELGTTWPVPSDRFVFADRQGRPIERFRTVETVLARAGLLFDSFGKKRSVYSLRHLYATQRLQRDVPVNELADIMGTSEAMIRRHYSHLNVRKRAHIHDGHLVTPNLDLTEPLRATLQVSPPDG